MKIQTDTGQPLWPRAGLLIPELETVPTIQMNLEDPAWKPSPLLEAAFPLGSSRRAEADVRFRVGHHKKVLYFRIEYVWQGDEEPLVREGLRGAGLWGDDGGEIFLAHPGRMDQPYQFVFNLKGEQSAHSIVYDRDVFNYFKDINELVRQVGSNELTWDLRVAQGNDYIAVIAAIPLGQIMGLTGEAGDVLRLNFVRNRSSRPYSIMHWSPVSGSLNCRSDYFGVAALCGPDPAEAAWSDLRPAAADGLLVLDSRVPVHALETEPVHLTLMNPLAEAGLKGAPEDLNLRLDQSDQGLHTEEKLAISAWPVRISITPDTSGEFLAALQGGQDLPGRLKVPVSWQDRVYIHAEDERMCRVTGNYRIRNYPRTVGRRTLDLLADSRLVLHTTGRAVYLHLPPVFNTPGPFYGGLATAAFRWRVDGGTWHDLPIQTAGRIVPLKEDLCAGDHILELEPVNGGASLYGFSVAREALSLVEAHVVTDHYSELLTDLRIDVYQKGECLRREFAGTPHNRHAAVLGLVPGTYRMVFTAAGWEPHTISEVVIAKPGSRIDLGIISLKRQALWGGAHHQAGPRFGRTVCAAPGDIFRAEVNMAEGVILHARLTSPYRMIELDVLQTRQYELGVWNNIGEAEFRVPPDTPQDMYDLHITTLMRKREVTFSMGQAVCIREELPKTFFLAGVGHMNTWGQKVSEYLAKVAATVELAGARHFLIANEVNAAYVSGALQHLRIPYAITSGNHTMARWKDFYGPGVAALDDGRLRIVTFGGWSYDRWNEPLERLTERAEATCRVLLCYEGFPPLHVAKAGGISMIFDAHSDTLHPDAARFPARTFHFRAEGQHCFRWIPMTPLGIDLAVETPDDISQFTVPREGPSPLRVQYDGPNNGTADKLTATIINEYEGEFPHGRLRLVLTAGKYRIENAAILQQFDSDDGAVTVIDVEVAIPPASEVVVRAVFQT